MEADGVDGAGTGLRPLRHPLHRSARATRTAGSPPSPTLVLRRAPGGGHRDHTRGGRRALPAARARCTASCTRPVRRGSTGAAWRPRSARRRAARGVEFVTGAAHGVVAGSGTGRAARRCRGGGRAPERGLRCGGRRRRRLDRGGGGVARHARCPSAPPRGRSCTSAWARTRATGRSCSRCSPTISCPWPGGRVACGGTFEAGAGFSVGVTAAGLLRAPPRVPDRGARAGRRHLPRDPGRAAADVGRRPCPGGPAAGLGQRLGGDGPRRQRPAAGALLGAAAGARHGGRRRCPADEAPLPALVRPGRFA